MKTKIYKFTHIAAYLTVLHGLIYFIVKYYMQVESPYGERPHWSQGYIQSIHIFLSPLLVFAIGMLWKDHIVMKFKHSARKRGSGITLFIICAVMIFSGYGIQSFYEETTKAVQTWAHLISSFLFVVAYAIHHFRK